MAKKTVKPKTSPKQGKAVSEPAAEPKKNGPEYWVKHEKKQNKLFTVIFFYDWCKSCGLCSSLCKAKIILTGDSGRPYIDEMDKCVGCRFCEIHCPDFAITVKQRYPDRRRHFDDE
ncbi:MAG: 4Fe-4S binding protein [Thermodesulfobacteriota bacterium]